MATRETPRLELLDRIERLKKFTLELEERLRNTQYCSQVEKAVKVLIAKNSRHKKKYHFIGDASFIDITDHMFEEVEEFDAANRLLDNDSTRKDKMLEELADIYGCLVHAAIKAGFSMHQVEQRELLKLKERFE